MLLTLKLKGPVLVALLLSLSYAATAQDSIQFLHPWKSGEQLNFKSSRSKSDYTRDTLYATTTFVYDVTLQVKQVTPKESLIELTYSANAKDYQEFKKSRTKDIVGNAVASFARQLYAFKSLKIIYTIDETGAFKRLKNGAALKEYISSALNAYQQDPKISSDFKGVLKQFAPAFLSDDFILYSFLMEVQALHQVYGVKWVPGKQTQDIEMPNPINGEPLPGTLTTALKKEQTGAPDGVAVYDLVMQQQIDSDKLTKTVEGAVTDTYQKINKPDNGTPSIESTLTYRYKIMDDLVQKLELTKRVASGGSRSTEQYILE